VEGERLSKRTLSHSLASASSTSSASRLSAGASSCVDISTQLFVNVRYVERLSWERFEVVDTV
jgi:hypothetical protein